jgi:hypothetical protein
MNDSDSDPDPEQAIRHRAHAIWEAEGRPDGKYVEHWQRALSEIERERKAAKRLADAAASPG